MFDSDADDSESDVDYEPSADELQTVKEETEKSNDQTSISDVEKFVPDKTHEEKVWKSFIADSKCGSLNVSKISESYPLELTNFDKLGSAGSKTECTKPLENNPKPQLFSKVSPNTAKGVKRHSTLNTVIGKISKKTKTTTLQKSIDDWNSFKREEGIEDSLRIYNKGKGGYIQKQTFLLKSDLACFERERELRLSKK